MGVVSLGTESDVRMDQLLGMLETTTDEVVGAAVFVPWSWMCPSEIALMASQSSSLSLVSPSLWMCAISAHCWSFLSAGSREATMGLAQLASANGLDQVEMSVFHLGPMGLEMLRRALPMPSLERLPVIVVLQ